MNETAPARGEAEAEAWRAHRRRQRRLIALGFVLALGVYSLLRYVIAPLLNPLLGL